MPVFSEKKITPFWQVSYIGTMAGYGIGYNFERTHCNTGKMLCKLHFSADFTYDCAKYLISV